MLKQAELIWLTNWKYLIILDACRYDYFEKVYKEFPELRSGKLLKAVSLGSTTTEWITKTFKGREYKKTVKDLVYVSANPYINSKGIALAGLNPKKYLSHIHKIVDVWDWGWSDELGTVHPQEVNKAVLVAVRLYERRRFIIHYLQPHYPYLSLRSQGIGPKLEKGQVWWSRFRGERSFKDRVKGFIRWRLVDIFGATLGEKIALKLVGPPSRLGPSCEELVAREVGLETLRKAYEDNLRIALRYVVELIKKLPKGLAIITGDHGELLGEYGMYGHLTWMRVPELIEVPWLELDIKDSKMIRI